MSSFVVPLKCEHSIDDGLWKSLNTPICEITMFYYEYQVVVDLRNPFTETLFHKLNVGLFTVWSSLFNVVNVLDFCLIFLGNVLDLDKCAFLFSPVWKRTWPKLAAPWVDLFDRPCEFLCFPPKKLVRFLFNDLFVQRLIERFLEAEIKLFVSLLSLLFDLFAPK